MPLDDEGTPAAQACLSPWQSDNALLDRSGEAFVLVDAVHPTGQYSKKCPQVDGHVVHLSARHAKVRREGYRKSQGE
jgi:hypothetical protein